jgi:hypothetical protein
MSLRALSCTKNKNAFVYLSVLSASVVKEATREIQELDIDNLIENGIPDQGRCGV